MERRSATVTDGMSRQPAVGLAALLDLPTDVITDGWQLPPLWHWVYLQDWPCQAELGPDGHPLHGIPEPPRPGMHRLYAGGRVTTHRPLRLGAPATSTIEVTDVRQRTGRSGPMTIVTTTRTIGQRGTTAIIDEVDILYRDPVPLPPAEHRADAPAQNVQNMWDFPVDETVLFRFSALTFNAHRIHYDVDYCRRAGYAGLVVHGPLQALLMAHYAYPASMPEVTSTFRYRLVAPLILGQGLLVGRSPNRGQETDTEVRDSSGRQTATGLLRWE